MVKRLECLPHDKKLRDLGVYSLEKGQEEFVDIYKHLTGGRGEWTRRRQTFLSDTQ